MTKKKKSILKKQPDVNKHINFSDILAVTGIIISVISLYVSLLIRSDTVELSKFSEKPIYYDISLYPNNQTSEAVVSEKYLSINLTLIVDDFNVEKKNFLNINYNSVFSKAKYYMVYDYSVKDNYYKYMRYSLDDMTEARMRFEDNYYVAPSKLNYALTPNKEYLYILIYTETTYQKNLDDYNTFKVHTK